MRPMRPIAMRPMRPTPLRNTTPPKLLALSPYLSGHVKDL